MSSNIPTRKSTRNVRKVENVLPASSVSGPTKSTNESNALAARSTRASSSSKLPVAPPTTKRDLTAPTASSRAKTEVRITKQDIERRKKAAPLAERPDARKNIAHGASTSAAAAKRDTLATKKSALGFSKGKARESARVPKKPLRRLPTGDHKQSSNTKRQYSEDSEENVLAILPLSTQPSGSRRPRSEYEDDARPAKRHHTDDSSSPGPTSSEEEVASSLCPIPEEQPQQETETIHPPLVWDDLDAEDLDDPAYAAEYAVEIFAHLREIEPKYTPSRDGWDRQLHVTMQERLALLDWLLEGPYSSITCFHQETWFLAVNLIDRFLCIRQVKFEKIQLVGVVALYIAAKVEETMIPALGTMLCWAIPDLMLPENTIPKKKKKSDPDPDPALVERVELLWAKSSHLFNRAERYVLEGLQWDLNFPSQLSFLRRGSKADYNDPEARLIAKYLLELASLYHPHVGTPASLLAAAALWLARLMQDRADWTPNLIHYTGYTEEELLPTASLMVTALVKPQDTFPTVFARWAGSGHRKMSLQCRRWAIDRWDEDSVVNLEESLKFLKEVARKRDEQRQQELAALASPTEVDG
ncbi:cyclin-like protein [Flagelloscypha sp. PMI_526]|nr:cyclin-like protein [Flagelloscypha sp. PMI_526]